MIRSALFAFAAVLAFGSTRITSAQTTALQRQLARIDFGVNGAGEFSRTVSGRITPTGAPNAGQIVSENPSSTLGALATLRYVVKPLVGFEVNYGYARYTENFSYQPPNFGVQTNVNEYTAGYLVTPDHKFFGLEPFVSAGLGTLEFKPTPRGGQGLLLQARAVYYYSAGVQQDVFSPHLGVRASFRQLFYLAPDFGANYLTIKQRAITSEPTVGFYVRF